MVYKQSTNHHSLSDWKGLLTMEISDRVPPFLKTAPILPTPPILWKKSEPPPLLFWENFEDYIKGGIPTMNMQVLFLYKLSWLIALSTSSHELVSKCFIILKLHISHMTQSEDVIYHLLLPWVSASKDLSTDIPLYSLYVVHM